MTGRVRKKNAREKIDGLPWPVWVPVMKLGRLLLPLLALVVVGAAALVVVGVVAALVVVGAAFVDVVEVGAASVDDVVCRV